MMMMMILLPGQKAAVYTNGPTSMRNNKQSGINIRAFYP